MRTSIARVAAVGLVTLLAACSSPRDKAARYVQEGQRLLHAHNIAGARLQARNALQVDPANARAFYLLALVSEQERDYAEAIAGLRRAVDADPGFLAARLKLGNYYTVGRRAAEARAQADAALALAPDDADVRMLEAWTCYVEGHPEQALGAVAKALALDPKRQDAATLGATLHAEAGRLDEAMAALDRGIAAAGPGGAEGLERVRVELLIRTGQAARAEQALRRLAGENRGSPAWDLALARFYAGQGRDAEAEQGYRRLLARDPGNATWWTEFAGLLVRQGRVADAEANLRHAVAARPQDAPLRLALGGFYESIRRRPDALAAYEGLATAAPWSQEGLAARNRLVALQVGVDDAKARALADGILADVPDNVDALLFRAFFRLQDHRPDEAIGDARAALVKQPDEPRVLLFLARAYVANGQVAQAGEVYRRLLGLDPGHDQARNELAALEVGRGRTKDAEALLRDALILNPADPRSSENLVTTLMLQKDYPAAEAEARRRLALGESSGLAEYQLGAALQAQAQDERAIAAYQESLRRNPGADAPLSSLVRLLAARGRVPEARAFLERHLAAHPDHVAARLLLGEVLRDGGHAEAARAQFRAVQARHPEAIGAWIGLASLAPAGSDERLAVLAAGHARNPADPQLGLALGSAWEKRLDFEKAIAVYDEVLRRGGDSDFVVNNLAVLLLDQRHDPASWQRALDLAARFSGPDVHPFNAAALGWAYYRTGRAAEGLPYLERAVAGEGRVPQLHYYLGMACLKTGDAARARRELRQAVDTARAQQAPFTGLAEAEAALRSLPPG